MARTRRDLAATARALEAWLASRLGAAEVAVSELSVPKAGFSNETLLGRARWSVAGLAHELRFALRVEPTEHQLFLEPDALFQARMMRALALHGVPVPGVVLEESDPSLLGAPFFVMQQVAGRIPPDVPGWHARGWTTELAADERRRLYDNGLAALAALHAIDWRDGFAFLERPGAGTALDRYLERVRAWHAWSAPSRRWGSEVIDAALAYVLAKRPGDATAALTWGDARVGNMIFADDLSVAALLDWEGAALGPPAIDLGWWLMFEEYFSAAMGVDRLAGVAGREETIARYEELAGRPVDSIDYYEILAGLVFALIISRLTDLAIAAGVAPDKATVYVKRNTDMLERNLDAWT